MAENSGEFDFTEDNPDNYGASSSLHESNALSQGSRSQSRTNFASQSGNNPSNIQMDGRNSNRDPPGQKSVYILPGDPEKETYRLSTYLKFPGIAPVDPCVLARHGFYYTGYEDRVKCFSCGALVQDWCINDNPKLARWHLNGCELVLGSDKSNKPIFNRPLEFVGTFTSSIPSLHSGYASSFGSSVMSSSSSFGSTKSLNPSSSSSLPLFPSYPSGRMAELPREARVGGDDMHQSNGIETPSQSVTKLANGFDSKLQIGQSKPVVQNGLSQLNGFCQQTAHLTDNNPVGTGIVKVQGLDLASVTTSKHRLLLTQILDLHKEADRIKSFETRKCPAVSKEALAKSGFFYLGNLDRCQCFSCSGVLRNWRYGDDVHQEHQRHFVDCKMVTNQEHRNIPLPTTFNGATVPRPSGLVEPPDPSPEEKLRLDREFSCLHPVNPHMRNLNARLQTFDRRWPSHKVLASTKHIAKAGFFFLGERDRAKCWYCNGGLQNWDPTDEPFIEHAKWFPGCEYVLRCKGVEFVKNIVSKFPNLRRPTLRNPRLDHRSGQLVNSNQEQPTQIPIVDPQATRGSAGEVLQNFSPAPSAGSSEHTLLNGQVVSPLIQQVLELGITNDEVQQALRVLQHQMIIPSCVNELLDVIYKLDTHSIPQLSSNAGATFRASPASFAHTASTFLYSNDYIEHPHEPRLQTPSLKIETSPFLSTGFISITQSLNPEFFRQMLSMGFLKEEIDFATTKKVKETGKGFESASEMVEFLLRQRTPAHKPLPKKEQPQASYFSTPSLSPTVSISSLPPQSQLVPIGVEPQQSSATDHETPRESNHEDDSSNMSLFIMINGNETTAKMGLEMLKFRHV